MEKHAGKSGVHDHVIMKITGHKTDIMFRRYDDVDLADLRDAVQRGDTQVTHGEVTAEAPACK